MTTDLRTALPAPTLRADLPALPARTTALASPAPGHVRSFAPPVPGPTLVPVLPPALPRPTPPVPPAVRPTRRRGHRALAVGVGVAVVTGAVLVGRSAAVPSPDPVDPPATTIAAPTTTAAPPTTDPVAVSAEVRRATVRIVAVGTTAEPGADAGPATWTGTGFFVDPSGVLVTNNHVVAGALDLEVYVDGEPSAFAAHVLGTAECSDLAVLQLDDAAGQQFPALSFSSVPLETGTPIFAAGYPLGDPEFTFTDGIISKATALGDSDWASVDHVVEHTANINPGNSGGPLVDEHGDVVGVNYSVYAEARQFFAIANDVAQPLVEQLRAGSDVGSIGVFGRAYDDGTDTGVWVSSVEPGSVAAQAGVRPGDLIVALDDMAVATDGMLGTFCDRISAYEAGTPTTITVKREGTGELLHGQLGGAALASVEGTGSSATADATGTFTVEVPAGWQVDGMATEEGHPHLSMAPDAANLGSVGVATSVMIEVLPADAADDPRGLVTDHGAQCSLLVADEDASSDGSTGWFTQWTSCGDDQGLSVAEYVFRDDADGRWVVVTMTFTEDQIDALELLGSTFKMAY